MNFPMLPSTKLSGPGVIAGGKDWWMELKRGALDGLPDGLTDGLLDGLLDGLIEVRACCPGDRTR